MDKVKINGYEVAVALLLAFPASIILRAYVVATLWFWFMVPLGVPVIGMAHALGLVSLSLCFTAYLLKISPEDKKSGALQPFIVQITQSLLILLCGYIYTLFM